MTKAVPTGVAGTELPAALLLRLFREMKRIRLLDETMVARQRQGRLGFYGPCTGQEAVPVAAALALEADDWVVPALREGAVMLARGFPLTTYLAQLYGSSEDTLKGRQMPSHGSGRAVKYVSWSSCIATQLPHAVGLAWAAKLRREPRVVLAFLGDGATSHGDFHSAMNFAGVFRVPIVFVCQNNQWAISVPVARQTASATLAVKASAYGIHGEQVDGNDVIACYRALAERVSVARAGGGPCFVECLTYRLGPHSTSDDPAAYREAAEVARWAANDPIRRLADVLRQQHLWSDHDETALTATLQAEILAAVTHAEAVPPPPRASLFTDVYAELPWHLREQQAALLAT